MNEDVRHQLIALRTCIFNSQLTMQDSHSVKSKAGN